MVSKNKASGLSARTEDFVHKQLNPHRHEYKLSKLSGIQVQPFTKTLTCFIFSSRHSSSDSPPTFCKEEDPFDWTETNPICFSLNRAQPTWESHFLKALIRLVNGSGPDSGPDEVGCWLMGWIMEFDTAGKSRKPEMKRIKKVKPNMEKMVKTLRDFNGMVVTDRANSESLSLHRLRERGYNWGGSVNEFDSKLGCCFRLFVRSEVFVFSSHVLCQVDSHNHRSEESYKLVRRSYFSYFFGQDMKE